MKARRFTPYGRGTPYALLAPGMLFFTAFLIIPCVYVFLLSFQSYSFVREARFVGLENYRILFGDGTFLSALVNSLVYLLVTPALLCVALAVAFALSRGVRGSRALRALYFLPVVTPAMVVGIMWRWIFNEDAGILNRALETCGLDSGGLPWLSVYPLNLIASMAVTLWRGIGFYAVIYLAGLAAIPVDTIEAATLDGAGRLQIFLRIELPQLRPLIALTAIISSLSALKVFDEIYVLIPGAPASEKTLVPLIYQTAFADFRLGYAAAMSVVLLILAMALAYGQLRSWREA